jgi:hypothetical protein
MTLGEKVAEIAALQRHGGDRRSEDFQADVHQLEKTQHGTSARYCLSRLKRDAPAIFAAVEAGEEKDNRPGCASSRCPGHNVRGIAVPSQERIGRSIAEHERADAMRCMRAR